MLILTVDTLFGIRTGGGGSVRITWYCGAPRSIGLRGFVFGGAKTEAELLEMQSCARYE
jgi:hypothetical protein